PVRPINQESTRVTRVPALACRLALSAARSPPAPPPMTSTSVSIRSPSSAVISSPRARAILDRGMHVDNVLRAEDLATEAGDAVLAKLDHRQELLLLQARHLVHDRRGLHVDDIGWTDQIAHAAARAFLELDPLDHVAHRSANCGDGRARI